MKISVTNVQHAANYRILDATGRVIPYVQAYDTETKEIELYLALAEPCMVDECKFHVLCGSRDDGSLYPISTSFVLPGSKAVDREGNEVL